MSEVNHEEECKKFCKKCLTEEEDKDYRNLLKAEWLGNNSELDKSLMYLSAGALAIIANLVFKVGFLSQLTFFLLLASAVIFLISILAVFLIYNKNRDYLMSIIKGETETVAYKSLKLDLRKMDGCARYTFLIGVLFLFIAGISSRTMAISEEKKQLGVCVESIEQKCSSQCKVSNDLSDDSINYNCSLSNTKEADVINSSHEGAEDMSTKTKTKRGIVEQEKR